MNIKKVYIAGPLNADAVGYLKNINIMLRMAEKVRKAGYSVFVPCLDLLMGIMAGDYEYKDYFNNNMAWLEASDCVLVLPNSQNSLGTQEEIAWALSKKIPIYHSLEQMCREQKA